MKPKVDKKMIGYPTGEEWADPWNEWEDSLNGKTARDIYNSYMEGRNPLTCTICYQEILNESDYSSKNMEELIAYIMLREKKTLKHFEINHTDMVTLTYLRI